LLINPAESLKVGLVDEVVLPDQVIARAISWCEQCLKLPQFAMLETRKLARADLVELFAGAEREWAEAAETWWHPETQAVLQSVAERLKKK
jgi:3,2-trans-enoyl-CoA isomerase